MTVGAHAVCQGCGATGQSDDAFCEACGTPVPRARRVETESGDAAGVTDGGLSRRRNEDAVRVATVGRASLAVVCDGVATSLSGGRAAEAAAEAACTHLARALGERSSPDGAKALAWDPRAATSSAMTAAQRAVVEVPWAGGGTADPPSCTLVSVVWDGAILTVGSVGDSRAYWAGPADMRMITVDDSWGGAITRWLGRDAPDGPWRVRSIVPDGRGRVVVCSDGLWGYAPTEEQLGALVSTAPPGPPIVLARWLADAAITAGGGDNVTVAVVEVDPENERDEERTL